MSFIVFLVRMFPLGSFSRVLNFFIDIFYLFAEAIFTCF